MAFKDNHSCFVIPKISVGLLCKKHNYSLFLFTGFLSTKEHNLAIKSYDVGLIFYTENMTKVVTALEISLQYGFKPHLQ